MLPLVAIIALAVLVFSYAGAYVRWRQRDERRKDAPPHRVRLG
jgi:hypothetical protein